MRQLGREGCGRSPRLPGLITVVALVLSKTEELLRIFGHIALQEQSYGFPAWKLSVCRSGEDDYWTTDDPHSWRPGPDAGGGRKGDSSIPSIYLPNKSFYGLSGDLATENICT